MTAGTSDSLWHFLLNSQLFWLSGTLLVWQFSVCVARRFTGNPLCNPVLLSIILIGGFLLLTGVDYATYFSGAKFIAFLLGPATVALAIPLYQEFLLVRQNLLPMACALAAGSIAAIVSVIILGHMFGFTPELIISLAPKSVTTAVAMAISDGLHGNMALTAVFVVLTGICGAVTVTPLMKLLRIRDPQAQGFAAGLAAHGIGTAHIFSVSPIAGLFAGVAMSFNAILTALIIHFFI